MYVESIKFKREKDSKWEKGYYLGEYENSEKSIILDENYNELKKDENNCRVWDYTPDLEKRIVFRVEL